MTKIRDSTPNCHSDIKVAYPTIYTEPRYRILIQGPVHLTRLTLFFSSVSTENRVEDTQIHRFISLFGAVLVLFLSK